MKAYLSKVRLFVYFVENYIELDEIKPIEETLQEVVRASLVVKIDLDDPGYFVCGFEETRVEFSDNPYDPIGFSDSAEINYLNIQSC